jgi:tRNA wybutosine-synthesizing protein 4
MAKKCQIVQGTPELSSMLTGLCQGQHQAIMLQTDQYTQIGCDLRQLDVVKDALSSVINIADCEFIFIAEVSITYMETSSADAVIKWAAELGPGEYQPCNTPGGRVWLKSV